MSERVKPQAGLLVALSGSNVRYAVVVEEQSAKAFQLRKPIQAPNIIVRQVNRVKLVLKGIRTRRAHDEQKSEQDTNENGSCNPPSPVTVSAATLPTPHVPVLRQDSQ